MIILWIVVGITCTLGAAAFFGAPYVPSHAKQVRRAFTRLRPLTSQDVVVDLGSGDGVVLRQAVKLGAGRAIGYEINPLLVWVARLLAVRRPEIEVRTANMWRVRPPKGTTVVYVFSVGRDLGRLTALLQRWAIQSDSTIECIMYGHALPGLEPIRKEGAHQLYVFTALHRQEAQV